MKLLSCIALFLIGSLAICLAEPGPETGLAPATWTWMIPLSPAAQTQHEGRGLRPRTRASRSYRTYTVSKKGPSDEPLISCFMKCSMMPPKREKRDSSDKVRDVVNQIVNGWRLLQSRSLILTKNFCVAEEADQNNLNCLKNKCQVGREDNKLLSKVIQSLEAMQNVTHEVCTNKDSHKLDCLAEAKPIFSDVIAGDRCETESENFKAEGATNPTGSKLVISGQKLCELFYCPAEEAKTLMSEGCKEFVYDVVSKWSDLQYYSFAFGFEEAKYLVRSLLNPESDTNKATGEKCADLTNY